MGGTGALPQVLAQFADAAFAAARLASSQQVADLILEKFEQPGQGEVAGRFGSRHAADSLARLLPLPSP
ncbi:hypothetical protein ACXXDK_12155 [Deinococcus sp. PESE-38]